MWKHCWLFSQRNNFQYVKIYFQNTPTNETLGTVLLAVNTCSPVSRVWDPCTNLSMTRVTAKSHRSPDDVPLRIVPWCNAGFQTVVRNCVWRATFLAVPKQLPSFKYVKGTFREVLYQSIALRHRLVAVWHICCQADSPDFLSFPLFVFFTLYCLNLLKRRDLNRSSCIVRIVKYVRRGLGV
jgi:hypothetical protein